MAITILKSEEDFNKFTGHTSSKPCVVHFSAEWSEACRQINTDVLPSLAEEYKHVLYAVIEAEAVPSVSTECSVSSVPTFVFYKDGKVVEKMEGANSARLNKRSKFYNTIAEFPDVPQGDATVSLEDRLRALVSQSPCMLFMKGTPSQPRCGFSSQIIALLQKYNVEYGHFDILSDEEVRQGLKEYSNWPTYPQLYVNGELLGGLDIIKEMDASGELKSQLPCLKDQPSDLDDRLKQLINKAPVMVFMKGQPDAPQCGFSRTLVSILNEFKIQFSHFDILQDEEVRQGLKVYSNWPTYPQVYCKGELVGGLDIIKEMKESNELVQALS